MTPKLLLNADEASEALSLSPRKIWELTRDGDLPSIRIGRSVRYDVEALREWIARKSQSGSAT
jgi:excisionase family DNA binding protein